MNFLQQYPSLNIRKKSHKAQTIIFFEGGGEGVLGNFQKKILSSANCWQNKNVKGKPWENVYKQLLYTIQVLVAHQKTLMHFIPLGVQWKKCIDMFAENWREEEDATRKANIFARHILKTEQNLAKKTEYCIYT